MLNRLEKKEKLWVNLKNVDRINFVDPSLSEKYRKKYYFYFIFYKEKKIFQKILK